MAKFGPPPGVGFRKGIETACYYPGADTIDLDLDASSWHGHPYTAAHEFGHWFDHRSRLGNSKENELFRSAVHRDWMQLQTKVDKLEAFLEDGSYWEDLSQTMFGMPKSSLNLEQRLVLAQYADTIGAITSGKYGYGHEMEYYNDDGAKKEAFANIFAAYVRKDKQFQLDFPNLMKYIEELIKRTPKIGKSNGK